MAGVTASAPNTAAPPLPVAVSVPRFLLMGLALLVPLVIDPFGVDTQGAKTLVLSLCGLAVLAMGASEVLRGSRRPAATTLAERLLIALLGWAALSLLWARNPQIGLTRVILLAAMVGLAIGVRELCTSASRAWLVLVSLLVAGTVAMAADAMAVVRATPLLGATELKQASVLFVHNNMASSYVTPLVPLLVAGAITARRPLQVLLWLAALVGLTLYLTLLGSRAGMLGALMAVALVGLLFVLRARLSRLRLPDRRWRFAAAGLVVLAALLPLSDRARGLAKDGFYRGVHALSFKLDDVSFRPLLWRKTIEMVREHPLTGVGAGNFVVEFPRFERQAAAKPHAHNDSLQVLAELGLPGLALFLALLASVAVMLGSVLCSACGPAAWVAAAGAFGSVLVLALVGQFEVPFALAATAGHLAVLIGVAGALVRLPAAEGGAPSTTREPVPPGRSSRLSAMITLVACVPALALTAIHVPGSWLLTRAEERAAAGDLHSARQLYSRVSDLRIGTHVPERMLGQLDLQRGDGEAALDHFREARLLCPFNSELAEDEGDAFMLLGRSGEAVERYREALAGSPTQEGSFSKLVLALAETGRLREAIDLLQFRVCTDRNATLASVQRLADLWRRLARSTEGNARIEALVASRHFHAVLLQEAEPAQLPDLNREYKDLTHQLQVLPGSPGSWWAVYDRFREQNSLRMPFTALWTSIDGDAHRLFPGYVEPLGPPIPGMWQMPP